MKRRIFAGMIVLSLAGMAACGNSENESVADNDVVSNIDSIETNNSAADTSFEEDPVEIVMAYYAASDPNGEQLQKVEDAINAISLETINVSVDLLPLSMGNWDQQINLMISGNEQLDLMPTFFAGSTALSSMITQNQLTVLDELLSEYAPDILSMIPEEYFNTTTYNGSIYAVPINKDNVSVVTFNMRTDILEELGLVEQAEAISSIQDIEEIFKIVDEQTDLIPLAPSGTGGVLNFADVLLYGDFEDAVTFDSLVQTYVVALSTDPETAVCLYDTEEYRKSVELLEDWFNKGYIHPDAAISQDDNFTYIASGKCFSYFASGENATAGIGSSRTGYDMTMIEVCRLPLSTSSVSTLTWTLPVTCREPEAAMKFLNLMYTNEDVVNLLNFGIENEDYIILEDGRIDYPEGQDANSVGYSVNETWLFGNQYLSHVFVPLDADVREQSRRINDSAELSPLFGFTTDISDYSTEITGLTNAYNTYARGLNCGTMDVDEALPQFQESLKAAGSDTLVKAIQAQLDAWRAEQ